MAFIPLPQGIRVALEFNLNGQLVVNVYHITYPNPVATVNLQALNAIFVNWWNLNQRQNFVAAIGLNRVISTDVSVANGLQEAFTVAPAIPGTVVGASSPNNVALVASMRTGFSGRSFRGRSYFAGVSAAEIADNFVSTPYAAAIAADQAALVSQLNAQNFTLVVASYRANGAPRVTGVATPVNAFIVETRVDTQRRRLPGTGE